MVPTTAGGRGPQLGGKGQLPGAGSLAHSESQGKEGILSRNLENKVEAKDIEFFKDIFYQVMIPRRAFFL